MPTQSAPTIFAFSNKTRGETMSATTLKELYVDELKDLYSAENQILKALPKMIKAASDDSLKTAFQEHLTQTEGHADRLKTIIEQLGEKPTGKLCKGMQGVLEEGAEALEESDEPAIRDAAIIAAAQRVEHYEMAGYGSAREFAKQLGETDAVTLLDQTLSEEEAADKKLSKIATSSVNKEALAVGA
jgi:ferritin-like metal-binding protein YciE